MDLQIHLLLLVELILLLPITGETLTIDSNGTLGATTLNGLTDVTPTASAVVGSVPQV